MAEEKKEGICYLVGAGPGDPGLMTLRGRECIEMADVVVCDYLSNPDLLQWARPDAELIFAGKESEKHAFPREEINRLLVEKAKEGKIITRLKGGDPLLFERGAEEAGELVKAGIKFEFVPGISSSFAGPAYAGIPLTDRNHCSQVTIFTGHEDPAGKEASIDYQQMASAPGTKVMLMGVERLPVITRSLIDSGADPDTPMALVRGATTGRQKTITGTIKTIAKIAGEARFEAPSIAVIGGVVECRESLNWFEDRPLRGKRVVVTRTRKQSGRLSRQLRELGADVLEMPTIRIERSDEEEYREFAKMVIGAHTYEWLIFTSPNAVEYFFDAFYKAREDAREIGGCRIAAVGPATKAKLAEYHMGVDLMPDTHVAEELAAKFESDVSVENSTMLWVRAKDARDVLSTRLIEAGAILDEAIAYQTVPETDDPTGARKRFESEGADIITFTSASTVECFLDLGLEIPEGILIASIGPITSRAILEEELELAIEAKSHDIPGLVEAVLELAEER